MAKKDKQLERKAGLAASVRQARPARSQPTPAPKSKSEATAQIKKLVEANKASLDALSKL